ncbi:MAG: putative lipid II flippase FtsW [Lachnospiraceae bacterium]|nr:putative lipid II flippase FtsW [Lachnospiraceae bacterium]
MDLLSKLENKRDKKREVHFFDYSLLIVVLFLVGFGLIMIYSASSYEAKLSFDNAAYYLRKQAIAAGLGIFVMLGVSFIPYKLYGKISSIIYISAGLILLIMLKIPGISYSANGATRWIRLFGGFTLQPAEVIKIIIIFVYAKLLESYSWLAKKWNGTLVLAVIALAFSGLVYLISDNLSSAIIIFLIALTMSFVACKDKKWLAIYSGSVAFIGAAAVLIILKFGQDSWGFRFRRILAWVHPENYSDDTSFQTLQSLYAIGSGGVFGKGLGESMQKLNYIPEAQNDMIFSIIVEELGLIGGICVLILFGILLYRMLVIASNTDDPYGALLVTGIMAHFAIQVILNIAVVTNTIPNTGISLPFISYGGSSVLFLLTEIGIVLNVGRNISFKNPKSE